VNRLWPLLAFYPYTSLPQALRCLPKTVGLRRSSWRPFGLPFGASMIISALLGKFGKHLRNACWGETHIRQKKAVTMPQPFELNSLGSIE
jgi:hypothetical protein